MYEITYVGKHDMARGLLATEDIDAGTRILTEAPYITLPLTFLTEPCNALREAHFGAFVERELNTYQLAVLQDLTNNNTSWRDSSQNRYGSQPYVGTVKTNAIPIDVAIGYEKFRQVGVFPTLSRTNHACKPNAHQTWNRDLKKVTLHAIHDIKAGEEITITYRPDSQVAPRWIHATYGFHCRCDFCRKDGEEARKLKRQTQLTDKRLDELMHEFEHSKGLQADLANCWERHLLCENAGVIDWRAGMAFLDGFHVVLKAGDLGRAEVFAEYVKKTVGFYEGEDSVALRRVYEKLNDFSKDVDAVKREQPGGRLVDEHGNMVDFKLNGAAGERKSVNEAKQNMDKGKGKEFARDKPAGESGGAIPKSEDDDEQNHGPEAYHAMMHWLFMVDDEDDQLNLTT